MFDYKAQGTGLHPSRSMVILCLALNLGIKVLGAPALMKIPEHAHDAEGSMTSAIKDTTCATHLAGG